MRWKYKARDRQGREVKGVLEAQDAKAAAAMLSQQKLMPVSVVEQRMIFDVSAWRARFGGVSVADLANFTRQLSIMITAGLPLTDALNLLKLQSSPALAPIVGNILTDVAGGMSLSSALDKHRSVFSKVYVALMRAGEAAGVVEKILSRLAENMEKSREFSAKVKGAMVYPAIILVGMLGVMGIMMVVVVPKLTALYTEFGTNLPAATKLIIGLSAFLSGYWWFIIIGVMGGVWVIRRYMGTPVGRRWRDDLIYRLPVVGELARQVMLAEMTRTMALLIGAGVSIVEALNIVSEALGNVIVETDMKKIAHQVEKGFPVAVSFSQAAVFPPLVGQMVAVGEETGRMDEVMEKLSIYFESNSGEKIKGLTTAIEPLIIIVLGVGVGFLIFSIIMPIYNLTSQF